jgi:hypothetical protein
LGTPAHSFLRGLLEHYCLELHHLNPNGVVHVAAFVALCEGYLGIEPNFDLWGYFGVDYLKDNVMGCVGIKQKSGRHIDYVSTRPSKSNKGWHSSWFYLKNDESAPFRAIPGRRRHRVSTIGGMGHRTTASLGWASS